MEIIENPGAQCGLVVVRFSRFPAFLVAPLEGNKSAALAAPLRLRPQGSRLARASSEGEKRERRTLQWSV